MAGCVSSLSPKRDGLPGDAQSCDLALPSASGPSEACAEPCCPTPLSRYCSGSTASCGQETLIHADPSLGQAITPASDRESFPYLLSFICCTPQLRKGWRECSSFMPRCFWPPALPLAPQITFGVLKTFDYAAKGSPCMGTPCSVPQCSFSIGLSHGTWCWRRRMVLSWLAELAQCKGWGFQHITVLS